ESIPLPPALTLRNLRGTHPLIKLISPMGAMSLDHGICMEDVHQLKSFLAVAENLSFTRAAETLFLTQSAVSHQIADLERELGVELFIRHGRTIELTPAARVLAERARRLFADLRDARLAVAAAAKPDQGRLRIGASAA